MQAPKIPICCNEPKLLVRTTVHEYYRELYCYNCREVVYREHSDARSLGQFVSLADSEEDHPLYLALKEVGKLVRAYDRMQLKRR